jgi:BMFP domain-containing protein YqiC
MTTLAEKLRAWQEAERMLAIADQAKRDAVEAVPPDLRGWQLRDGYLRGHDDRQSEIDALTAEVEKWKGRYYDVADAVARESTGVEDLCRQARQTRETCAALTARVRELEAQSAAVGVVGAVIGWAVVDDLDCLVSNTCTREQAAERASKALDRVVAIVDPAQMVPLASATAVGVVSSSGSLFHQDMLNVAGWSDCAPVYSGIAQPAQEREG